MGKEAKNRTLEDNMTKLKSLITVSIFAFSPVAMLLASQLSIPTSLDTSIKERALQKQWNKMETKVLTITAKTNHLANIKVQNN